MADSAAENEDSLAIQTPLNIASDAVEAETAVTGGAETLDVIETEDAVTARAGTSDGVEIEAAVTIRAETSDVVETEVIVTARAETSLVVEAEATSTARAETSEAIDECRPQAVPLQQSCDVSPTSLDPAPATEVPLEHVINDSLAKEAENGPITDTTLVTIRRGRKSKKEPSQPVRSSRRLQQRQSRSAEFTLNLVDSLAPVEQVTSGMNIDSDQSAEEKRAEIVPDIEQATTGREELTNADDIIEEVLKDLQQVDQGTWVFLFGSQFEIRKIQSVLDLV